MRKILAFILCITPLLGFSQSARYGKDWFFKSQARNPICYPSVIHKTMLMRHYCLKHHISCAVVFSRGFPELVYSMQGTPAYGIVSAQKQAYVSAIFFKTSQYVEQGSKKNQPYYGFNGLKYAAHTIQPSFGGIWLQTPHCQQNGIGVGIATSKNHNLRYPGYEEDIQNLQILLTDNSGHQFTLNQLKKEKNLTFNDALLLATNYGRQLCLKHKTLCTVAFANSHGRILSIAIAGWQSHIFSQIAMNRAISAGINATTGTFHLMNHLTSPFNNYIGYMPGGKQLIINGKLIGAFGLSAAQEWTNTKSINIQHMENQIVQYFHHIYPKVNS